jgi:chorismate mutase
VALRAIRGATQVDTDQRDEVLVAVQELLQEVLDRNALSSDDLVSILFTATPDITSMFPALAVRHMGLSDVPLLCAVEMAVPGALPRVVRLMAHAETELPRSDVNHVYLRGAVALRPDLAT